MITKLQDGYTQSKIIRQLQNLYGYFKSRTLEHRYMEQLIKQYSLTVTRYRSSEQTRAVTHGMGAIGNKYNYLTRKGIFQYLWMPCLLHKITHIYGAIIQFSDNRKLDHRFPTMVNKVSVEMIGTNEESIIVIEKELI